MKNSLKALLPLFILCSMVVGLLFSSFVTYAAPPNIPPWMQQTRPWRPKPTQPPPVVTPPSETPTNGDVVGYIGCSMTQGIGYGLKNMGSTAGWQPVPDIGGGGIKQWSENFNNKYWSEFQKAYNAQPTNTIMWELCALENSKAEETLDNAKDVIDELKRRVPGATIYVSAQPYYNPSSHTCSIAGQSGVDRMAGIVASLVSEGYAKQGPTFGPLAYPGQTVADGCHPNSSGEKLMAEQFISFFLTNKPPTPTEPPIDPCNPPPVPVPTPGAGIASGIYVVDDGDQDFIKALNQPFVDGALVRVRWSQLEASEGSRNFAGLCTKITQAHNVGKKVSLVNYPLGPSWLLSKISTWQHPAFGKQPVPWDKTAQAAFKSFLEAEADAVCGGYKIKEHPALAQVDNTVVGALSVRDMPSNGTLELMKSAVLESVKMGHEAFYVKDDPKVYYLGLFPLGKGTSAVSDAKAIWSEVEKLYPMQHAFMENFDVVGPSGTIVEPFKATKFKMFQACNYFSQPDRIKCSGSGVSNNDPKNAYEKIAKPLGVKYFEVYPDDLNYPDYKSMFEYIQDDIAK